MGMNLRPFGRTGLMISPLTLGTMEFGSKVDETEASRLLASAVDAGVNAVDTANVTDHQSRTPEGPKVHARPTLPPYS